MKKLLLFSLLLILVPHLPAQHIHPDSIDQIFSQWNQPDVPGGAVAVVKNGRIVYSKGYGIADLEHDIPITPSTVFYIGSVSKQFVTFSLLLLQEQGKLDLDDEIQEYLPDFPRYDAPLTIRHFIHHTSGVRDYLTLMRLKGRSYLDHIEMQEAYELIKNQKELNFSPGEQFLYSNSCYLMLAIIIEKASGMSLKKFAEEEIFAPLGMEHSQFYDDITDLIKNRAFSYSNNGDGFDNLVSRFDLVGSGGIYSTVEDLYLWDQNFYDNQLGKGRQALIDTMQTDGRLNNGESIGYAFALGNGTYRGLKTVSHAGALAGYRAYYTRFPEQEFSVIILSNRNDGEPAEKAYQVADLYLADYFEPGSKTDNEITEDIEVPENTTQPFELDMMTGRYHIGPGIITVRLADDSLRFHQHWNDVTFTVYRSKGNTFKIPDDPSLRILFHDFDANSARKLSIHFANGSEQGERIPDIKWSSRKFSEFTGTYYSEELDVAYEIFIEDNTLKRKIGFRDPQELTYVSDNRFSAPYNVYRFERDTEGKITGFRLDAGRVTNLAFEKQTPDSF